MSSAILSSEVIIMKRLISRCPSCDGELVISTLQCPDCGMEFKSSFELSVFDKLSDEQNGFLLAFLRARGNLKEVQSEMSISYPTAKKKLDELLDALNLGSEEKCAEPKVVDLSRLNVDHGSNCASEIVKAKLKDHGGHTTVFTARGLPCEVYAEPDGETFTSDKLPTSLAFDYGIFDAIVELLLKQDGRARKGNGRNFKLGETGCEESTVVGTVALHMGHKKGDSIHDPVFVLAAILEWAGIAVNGRGELILTDEYRSML